jgi:hypothetical protein
MAKMATTVLSHIAATVPQKENLATEALAFILNRSSAARSALAAQLAQLTGALPPISSVQTQVAAGEESRPDIGLLDERGALVGFLEAKFWAALTDAQPGAYLERLREHGHEQERVLVMLAPARRAATLRNEVIGRCRSAGSSIIEQRSTTIVVDGAHVVFLSWSSLLAALHDAVLGDQATLSDVMQLEGLVARFETEGFIPLTNADIEDLEVPRRVLALAELVNDILEVASNERAADGSMLLSTKGLRPTHYLGATGRYAKFEKAGFWLGLSHWQWLRYGRTPLWVRFGRDDWGRADELRVALRDWIAQTPPRAYVTDDDGAVRVPILIRPGAERDQVIAHATTQLGELRAKVQASALPLLGTAEPKEPGVKATP